MRTMFIDPGTRETEVQIKNDERRVIYTGKFREPGRETAHICAHMCLRHQVEKIGFDTTGIGETFGRLLADAAYAIGGAEFAKKVKAIATGYFYHSLDSIDRNYVPEFKGRFPHV